MTAQDVLSLLLLAVHNGMAASGTLLADFESPGEREHIPDLRA